MPKVKQIEVYWMPNDGWNYTVLTETGKDVGILDGDMETSIGLLLDEVAEVYGCGDGTKVVDPRGLSGHMVFPK